MSENASEVLTIEKGNMQKKFSEFLILFIAGNDEIFGKEIVLKSSQWLDYS